MGVGARYTTQDQVCDLVPASLRFYWSEDSGGIFYVDCLRRGIRTVAVHSAKTH